MTDQEMNETHSSHDDPVLSMHSCLECKAMVNRYQDRELNEAVARKLGWTMFSSQAMDKSGPITTHWVSSNGGESRPIPAYSTSIAAAWEIVADLEKRDLWIKIFDERGYSDGWTVNLDDCKAMTQAEATADTAPKAICLAFLKLEDNR